MVGHSVSSSANFKSKKLVTFKAKIEQLEMVRTTINVNTTAVDMSVDKSIRETLASLKLNNFFAECRTFEAGKKEKIDFKRSFTKDRVFLDSTNNFEVLGVANKLSPDSPAFEVRKMKQIAEEGDSEVVYNLEGGDWNPSICVLVCDNCRSIR